MKLFNKNKSTVKAYNLNSFAVNRFNESSYADNIDKSITGNSVVASCIEKRTEPFNDVAWYVERQKSDGSWEKEDGHKLNNIIKNNDAMGFTNLLKLCEINKILHGNYIIHKLRGGMDNLVSLEPIVVSSIKPVINTAGDQIFEYEYKVGKHKITIDPKDIIHGMNLNPENLHWGNSIIDSIEKEINTFNAIVNNLYVVMKAGGVSPGLIHIDGIEMDYEDEEALELAKQQVEQLWNQIVRAAENGYPVIVSGDFKMEKFVEDISKLDHIGKLKYLRGVIAGRLKVPVVLIGDLENATLANVVQYKKELWESAIIPSLNEFYDTFNREIQTEFPGYRINYSLDGVAVLRDDLNSKLDAASKLQSLGVPVAEINRLLDLGLELSEIEGV